MSGDFEEKLSGFKEYLKELEYLNSAFSVLYWDSRVNLPRKAHPYRGEVLGYISNSQYKLQTSAELKAYIDYFLSCKEPDDVTKAMADKQQREYNRTMKIPENIYREYVVAVSAAEAAWEQAKNNSDYAAFKPHLKKLIDFNREFIEYWGAGGSKYDALMDYYEPGVTVEKLDKVFSELRDAIISLLDRIKNSTVRPDTSIFGRGYTAVDQKGFCEHILRKMGYDFEAGRLDESAHPFTINFDNKDVRITTNYHEDDLRPALFGSIHEGGHGIYEQDISDELIGTTLCTGASMGIHESQSRFYENLLGRSRPFWKYFFPEAQRRFPSQFSGVSFDDFYTSINAVAPSLIRIEADELTYSLHIIIRYEIEKAIFNGGADVDELPEMWNAKYKEYLGVEPGNDAEGILQDTHWSGGNFGYFPSYALGNLYGAQFLSAMSKAIPDMDARVEGGDLKSVHDWLKDNIHRHGSVYKPAELIKMVTGEELNARYFIDYLRKKYTEIYKL